MNLDPHSICINPLHFGCQRYANTACRAFHCDVVTALTSNYTSLTDTRDYLVLFDKISIIILISLLTILLTIPRLNKLLMIDKLILSFGHDRVE